MAIERPKNWRHDRTSFFKYADQTAASAVLDSCSLRWSSPRVFNDPFDMQFDLFVDLDQKKIRRHTIGLLWKAFYSPEELDAGNPFGESIKEYKSVFPRLSRDDFEREFSEPIHEMCRRVPLQVAELNREFQSFLRDTKLLCLSERCDSVLMWSHYAQCIRA